MDKKEVGDLLSGCLHNDRKSQQALYEQFYNYALSVALPYCVREEDAREVVNDAFLKVFTTIERFNPTYSFATWLRTIVTRMAINRYKSVRNEYAILDITDGPDIPVEDGFISKMAVEEVLKLVQKLPSAYRLTLILYAIEGYTHPEIAELLEVSVGTSKSNLFKAKARLKQMMTNQTPEKYG